MTAGKGRDENINIEILYKDAHVVVCRKPAGLVCEDGGKESLLRSLARTIASGESTEPELYPVHRLDRDTVGIVVYALSAQAAASLSAQIAEGRWSKVYRALLWGIPEEDEGVLCDLLFYDRKRSRSYVVDRERKGVKRASLEYKIISRCSDNKRSEAEIKLHTGRTHQIRVQFASRKTPLCGDRRYGAPAESGDSLALCAVSLSLFHPISGKAMSFSISAPWDSEESEK